VTQKLPRKVSEEVTVVMMTSVALRKKRKMSQQVRMKELQKRRNVEAIRRSLLVQRIMTLIVIKLSVFMM